MRDACVHGVSSTGVVGALEVEDDRKATERSKFVWCCAPFLTLRKHVLETAVARALPATPNTGIR